MQDIKKRKSIQNVMEITIILVFCALAVVLDFVDIIYLKNELQNAMLAKIIQQCCGVIAAVVLMRRFNIRLFERPQGWLYLIPCLIIAIDNFQFSAYFNGHMKLLHKSIWDFVLLAAYCFAIGLFEECIFRGVIFSVIAGIFPSNKKGFLLTFVLSSLIFGVAHFLNGFSFGTLQQVGYTILTGGLFAFCLIKTKNIFCCGAIHGIYNFCGILFERFDPETGVIGLGSGVIFDTGTIITMLVVSILVGLFVVFKTVTYKEEERKDLYAKLGVKPKKAKTQTNSGDDITNE